MTSTVTCTVCGKEVGRLGIGKHAGMHRRQFAEVFGRPPRSYDEVRNNAEAVLSGVKSDATTLEDYSDP